MFLKDSETDLVLDHRNGRVPEDKVLKDMRQHFSEKYGIELLDYFCSTIKDKPVDRKRVGFFIWTFGEVYKYRWDILRSEMEPEVKNAFSEACRKHGLNPDYYDPGD